MGNTLQSVSHLIPTEKLLRLPRLWPFYVRLCCNAKDCSFESSTLSASYRRSIALFYKTGSFYSFQKPTSKTFVGVGVGVGNLSCPKNMFRTPIIFLIAVGLNACGVNARSANKPSNGTLLGIVFGIVGLICMFFCYNHRHWLHWCVFIGIGVVVILVAYKRRRSLRRQREAELGTSSINPNDKEIGVMGKIKNSLTTAPGYPKLPERETPAGPQYLKTLLPTSWYSSIWISPHL